MAPKVDFERVSGQLGKQMSVGRNVSQPSILFDAHRVDCLRGLPLLVVDDQEDARELMAVVLEAAGAKVTLADSASTAMAALAGGKFAVLISDIGMPISDGYDLIREVRNAGDSLPSAGIAALAVTAFGAPEYRRQALASGFQEHLGKPVDIVKLVDAVARLAEMVPV